MIVRISEDKFTADENIQILAPGKFWEPTPPGEYDVYENGSAVMVAGSNCLQIVPASMGVTPPPVQVTKKEKTEDK